MVLAVKNIVSFLIDTLVGAIIETIVTPLSLTLSVVKVGTVFAGALM